MSLATFTIYRSPSDYPGLYVVRRHTCADGRTVPDLQPTAVVRTFAEARAAIPDGLVCFQRHENDDPVIVETWL